MKTRMHARRRGFTIVEMLVAVALIAVLVALTAGAFLKVRNVAQEQANNSLMSKLNAQFDKRWRTIVDDSLSSTTAQIPDAVVTAAGGDRELARVMWFHMKARNEFPTTFREARNATVIPGYSLSARGVFARLPDVPITVEPELQSAICLYIALHDTGNRGEVMNLEGLQVTDVEFPGSTTTYPVFVDPWGTPIAFCRMCYTPEVNVPPYARPGPPAGRNMADPQGKLARMAKPNQLAFWTLVTQNHLPYTWNVPGSGPQPFPAGFSQTGFPYDVEGSNPPTGPWNWVPTLVSAGPNKQFYSTGGGTMYLFGGPSADAANDNMLSFRLRREGNRSD